MKQSFRDLSLNEMELVLEVASVASLRGAARARGLTPSHASKILARIERRSGLRIFNRSVNGLSITREGSTLVASLREILRAADGLDGERTSSPVLGVGSMHFLNNELVAPALQATAADYQDWRFRLTDLKPHQLVGAGIRGAFELAVHIDPLEWPRTWSSALVGHLPWILIGRAGHPLGRRTSAAKLANVPFITPTYWRGDGFIRGNDFCPIEARERRYGHEASSATGAVALARDSDHVAFVPKVAAEPFLTSGAVVEIAVSDWDEFLMPVFLTVKSEAVPARLQKVLLKEIGARLNERKSPRRS